MAAYPCSLAQCTSQLGNPSHVKKYILPVLFFVTAPVFGQIDIRSLDNYANQPIPGYISPAKDNTPANNPITDAGATLGRVLFYDKNLSSDNSVSCASCHQQDNSFSDPAQLSLGVNGLTGRHSMRLINARFAVEQRFFWDERAINLEQQTTMPIQDHNEMGFSGTQGDGNLNDLIAKLDAIPYYDVLFELAYGSETITELRIQRALAQFIRSIQSFDSKYDIGRAMVPNDGQPFPNFTTNENLGKQLYLQNFNSVPDTFNGMPVSRRVNGGLNCNVCHRAPEFDIAPNSQSNGNLLVVNSNQIDATNTRSPSLRDLFNQNGELTGGSFHSGSNAANGIEAITDHYNLPHTGPGPPNPNLDPRLRPGGRPQLLNITPLEIARLDAFLKTLTGSNVYTDEKWSDPFNADGTLELIVPGQPTSYSITAGVYAQGDLASLTNSDDSDLTIRRSSSDVSSRVFLEIEAISPTATPTEVLFMLEGSVFARTNVVQSIEFWNYDTEAWVEFDSRNASRFADSTAVAGATGDLTRFVEESTLNVRARIRLQSQNPRQQFSANIDHAEWVIN